MVYTKINPVETSPLTFADLNRMETQYEEFRTIFDPHIHDDLYYTKSEADAKYFTIDTDGSGSGLDADKVDGYHADDIIALAIPAKGVAVWGGDIESIPAGWHLCDGSNGTPDLRGRFVIGVGTGYVKGQTGGDTYIVPTGSVDIAGHALTINEIPSHYHAYTDIQQQTGAASVPGGSWVPKYDYLRYTGYAGEDEPHGHLGTFVGDAYDNRPTYYALCYIMKL